MTDSGMGYQQFFAELKRRRVFRVMAAYGVIGFGIIEAAEAVFPRVGLPDWTVTLVVWLTLLGFPIAAALAWAFDLTSKGIERTADAEPGEISEILAQPASKHWLSGLLALAGVVLLFGGGWWMGQRGSAGRFPSLAIPEAQADGFRTLAVLPFDNVSGDEENRVLASGLHMDLQAQLARLAELRVTSPMSVREFEASDKGVREIADELGVDHILRGSVRRSVNQVRVDVQLIDAETNENLWFAQFDREVTSENLFEIQSDIARRVAEHLEASLSPADVDRLGSGPSTDNLVALHWYHRARTAAFSVDETARDAVAYAERAVELAPEFVEAWSYLTRMRALLVVSGEGDREAVLEAAEKTESLAPGSLEAIAARGYYTYYVKLELESALSMFQEAEQLSPSDADILQVIGWLQGRLGDFAEGARTHRRAAALDPQNVRRLDGLVGALTNLGRYSAADRIVERMMAIDPLGGRAGKVWLTFYIDRDTRRAGSLAAEMGFDPANWREGWALAWLAIYDRDYETATQALARMPSDELVVSEWYRLWTLGMVEQLKGGDTRPFSDSITALGELSFSNVGTTDLTTANSLLLAGQEVAGWSLLEEVVEKARSSDDHRESHSQLSFAAQTYAQFGRLDDALRLLEDIVDKPGDGNMHFAELELNPRYDGLRVNPRYEAILRRREAFEAQAALDAEAEGPWLP